MKTRNTMMTAAAAALLITAAHTANAEIIEGRCGENVFWSLNTNDSTLTISGTENMYTYYRNEDVPWFEYRNNIKYLYIKGKITNIATRSFYGNTAVKLMTGNCGETEIDESGETSFDATVTFSLDIETGVLTVSGTGGSMVNDYYPWKSYRKNIKHVVVDSGVHTIGTHAFSGMGIESVTLSKGLSNIRDSAFFGCTMLTSIDIPEGEQVIASQNAFSNSALASITLREGSHSGNYSFSGCNMLTSVYNYAFVPQNISEKDRVFYNTPVRNADLYVPPSAVAAYKKAEVWKNFRSIQPIPDWVPVTGVKLEKTTLYLEPYEDAYLKVTVIPENASNKRIYCGGLCGGGSFDKIYVNGYDKLFTVTTADGGFTASCNVVRSTPKNQAAKKAAPAKPKTPAKK